MNIVAIIALVVMDVWLPGNLADVNLNLDGQRPLLDSSLGHNSAPAALRAPPSYDIKQSLFQTLDNYHVEGTLVNESKYLWVAYVSHSRTDFPFLCTAACLATGVFATSARSLVTAKVAYTTLRYKNVRFRVKTFVLPSKPSQQWFDDIGLIVVEPNPAFKTTWSTISLVDIKRVPNKNNEFKWFEDLNYEKQSVQHKVVGYATDKSSSKKLAPNVVFRLYELPVVVGINMCEKTFSKQLKNQYHVPCYYYCDLNLPKFKDLTKCQKYLGSNGGAVVNTKSGKLLGVATWTISASELPVGIAVANSEQFKKDLACAKKIQADNTKNPPKGHYQKLCPD